MNAGCVLCTDTMCLRAVFSGGMNAGSVLCTDTMCLRAVFRNAGSVLYTDTMCLRAVFSGGMNAGSVLCTDRVCLRAVFCVLTQYICVLQASALPRLSDAGNVGRLYVIVTSLYDGGA